MASGHGPANNVYVVGLSLDELNAIWRAKLIADQYLNHIQAGRVQTSVMLTWSEDGLRNTSRTLEDLVERAGGWNGH